jgi:hypothetical protein
MGMVHAYIVLNLSNYVCIHAYRQQRDASAVSGKLTMSKLSNAIKEKIAAVLSSSSHPERSHTKNNEVGVSTSPETISALVS